MTASDPDSAAARRRTLAIVFVTVVIDLLGFGVVLPLLPRYAETLQASGFVIGLLMASFSAMQFLFAPLWGAISDRWGRRPVLIAGLAGTAACYALFGYASSLGPSGLWLGQGALFWMFVARIGAGIAGGTISTSQACIADVTDRTQRARGMALIGAAFGVGFTFGPLLGAVSLYNMQPGELPSAPGYAAAILSACAMIWTILRLPETNLNRGATGGESGRGWQQLAKIGLAFRHPVIGGVLLANFLAVFSFAQFETTLALLTEHLGLDERQNYLIFAYIGFVLTLAQGGLVRRVAPKLGEFRMAILGISALIVGLLLVGATGALNSLGLLIAVIPLTVVGFSFSSPAFQSLLSIHAAADEQGEILGLGQSIAALARIGGPVLGLTLQSRGVSLPYWSAAGIMAVAWLLTWSLRGRLAAGTPAETH